MSIIRACCLIFLLACAPALRAVDGVNLGGGNLGPKDETAKFLALKEIGATVCRVPLGGDAYWNGAAPTPEKADAIILQAHRHGVEPVLLFEYYTRWNGPLGGYDKWRSIGESFARRFAPNSPWLLAQGIRDWGVAAYTAINEPEWKSNNPDPIDPEAYARALEGLADGVHAVDAALKVSPGGYQEVPLNSGKDPYLKAVANLYNQGKLHAVDIHRYWDVDYVPMEGGTHWSLQNQFDRAKEEAGITADVHFHTTEMNFKRRKVTEDEAARGFLTALWDALTVTGERGQPVTEFVMPWNIFNLETQDDHYGLCSRLEPWTPNARGRVLLLVGRLTRGMEIVSCDPNGTGVTVLEGRGRRMWVWQNRAKWSSLHGTTFRLAGIPEGAARLEIYHWKGKLRERPLGGDSSIAVENLPVGETLMFLAVEEGPSP